MARLANSGMQLSVYAMSLLVVIRHSVFVHKLICEGTIEERVVAMQQKKAALVEGLLSGRTDKLQLTQADIQALFAVE